MKIFDDRPGAETPAPRAPPPGRISPGRKKEKKSNGNKSARVLLTVTKKARDLTVLLLSGAVPSLFSARDLFVSEGHRTVFYSSYGRRGDGFLPGVRWGAYIRLYA